MTALQGEVDEGFRFQQTVADKADAVLAAGVFHFGQIRIPELKCFLKGKGIVGCDIGTQTIAYTTETKVGLKNLAERGSCIEVNERKERRIYRAMDRSRRAMNPDNYNEDGTIKKGKKQWILSNLCAKCSA